jgi:DNA-binding transcriptional MocR family regulator
MPPEPFIPGLRIDAGSAEPVYRQIAEAIRAAAESGRLLPGRRLPPTRDLARQLGVNRNTVVAAYDQLAEEGVLSSHTGKGTFLAPRLDRPEPAAVRESWSTSFSRAVEGPAVTRLFSFYQQAIATEGISFSGSYPAPELMPVGAFSRALVAVLQEDGERALVYGPTAGHLALREAIAAQMRERGCPVSADGLLVTNGAQQAIELVFHAFLERGDAALIEEPTYTGALSVLASLGARVIGLPLDEEGVRADLLETALQRHRPKLIYLQPTFQNPTTVVMSEARRRDVLALAARHQCMVVEDDWASGLRYEGPEPPTLHALDSGQHVVHLSTFSKKLLPGLRVGWVAAPPHVMERLLALKQIRDCGTSLVLQAALQRFLQEGGMEEHLRRILPAYRQRRDGMLQALARHFPATARWTRPRGGLFLWVSLPRHIDGRELAQAAQQEKVFYSKGELFHSNGEGGHTLRLTFSAVTPQQIETGVATLGRLIQQRSAQDADGGARGAVEVLPIF